MTTVVYNRNYLSRMRHAFGEMFFPILGNPTEKRSTMAKKVKKVVKKTAAKKKKK
jgi:hypothetical protein